jgi:hypothetical protein
MGTCPAAIKVGRGEYSRPRPGKEIQSARGLGGAGVGQLDLSNPERRIHLDVPTRGPKIYAGAEPKCRRSPSGSPDAVTGISV